MESVSNLDRVRECVGILPAPHENIIGIRDVLGRLHDDEVGHKAACISLKEQCKDIDIDIYFRLHPQGGFSAIHVIHSGKKST